MHYTLTGETHYNSLVHDYTADDKSVITQIHFMSFVIYSHWKLQPYGFHVCTKEASLLYENGCLQRHTFPCFQTQQNTNFVIQFGPNLCKNPMNLFGHAKQTAISNIQLQILERLCRELMLFVQSLQTRWFHQRVISFPSSV